MEAKDGFTYLGNFISFEIWLFLVCLSSIVFYLILTMRINPKKLLFDKNQTGTYSWERVQLLVITLMGVLYYLIEVRDNPGKVPQIPEELILILGGSNALYLGRKLYLSLGR